MSKMLQSRSWKLQQIDFDAVSNNSGFSKKNFEKKKISKIIFEM